MAFPPASASLRDRQKLLLSLALIKLNIGRLQSADILHMLDAVAAGEAAALQQQQTLDTVHAWLEAALVAPYCGRAVNQQHRVTASRLFLDSQIVLRLYKAAKPLLSAACSSSSPSPVVVKLCGVLCDCLVICLVSARNLWPADDVRSIDNARHELYLQAEQSSIAAALKMAMNVTTAIKQNGSQSVTAAVGHDSHPGSLYMEIAAWLLFLWQQICLALPGGPSLPLTRMISLSVTVSPAAGLANAVLQSPQYAQVAAGASASTAVTLAAPAVTAATAQPHQSAAGHNQSSRQQQMLHTAVWTFLQRPCMVPARAALPASWPYPALTAP